MTRHRLLRVLAVAALIGVAVAAAAVLQSNDTPPSSSPGAATGAARHTPPHPSTAKPKSGSPECDAVDALAQEWMAPVPQGETDDQHSERIADKARTTADSASSPAIKRDLNLWADGFSLLAESQRLSGDPAAADVSAMASRAEHTIALAADALHQACPDGWPTHH